MKRRISNGLLILAILLTGTISCEKNRNSGTPAEKARKILELEARMNALNSGTGKMTNFMSVIGYSQLKEGTLNVAGEGSEPGYYDSVYKDTTNYWVPVTCAKVSEFDNEDGTHTTIYDYGDGCDEYGSLTKGKITYIWKNFENSYTSEVIYDHYYSWGMEMNGISKYSFTSDGDSYVTINDKDASGDSILTCMPVFFNWSGSSTGHDDMTIKYDDGNTCEYRSDYSNVWTNSSYKVLQGEYFYASTVDNYEYHYLVNEPLISNYDCGNTWVPVSGIETISTTENGETHEYSLNYGDGACDNLAVLTENGESSVVDFGEIYKGIDGGGIVEPAYYYQKGAK
jgi:hypothetical protein